MRFKQDNGKNRYKKNKQNKQKKNQTKTTHTQSHVIKKKKKRGG